MEQSLFWMDNPPDFIHLFFSVNFDGIWRLIIRLRRLSVKRSVAETYPFKTGAAHLTEIAPKSPFLDV